MNKELLFYSRFMLLGSFISAVSQVMLKKASQRKYESRIKEYLNPLVICAYAIFLMATLCAVYAYKVVPLSMGPVLESTSYIFVTAFSVLLFREKITIKRVVALLLIICGITVYAVTSKIAT